MFITATEINAISGIEVEDQTVRLAQLMIESWIGRSEIEVLDGHNRDIVAKAVMFQALYIASNPHDMLEQAAVTHVSTGDMTTDFDRDLFAPYMSPWAIRTARKLSWMGARTVRTGPIMGGAWS